jgi:hypothetical protein
LSSSLSLSSSNSTLFAMLTLALRFGQIKHILQWSLLHLRGDGMETSRESPFEIFHSCRDSFNADELMALHLARSLVRSAWVAGVPNSVTFFARSFWRESAVLWVFPFGWLVGRAGFHFDDR